MDAGLILVHNPLADVPLPFGLVGRRARILASGFHSALVKASR
jgi:hypothetical protein